MNIKDRILFRELSEKDNELFVGDVVYYFKKYYLVKEIIIRKGNLIHFCEGYEKLKDVKRRIKRKKGDIEFYAIHVDGRLVGHIF